MLKVVFTGPGHDGNGNPILRADLIAATQAAGHKVLPSMQHGAEQQVTSPTAGWTCTGSSRRRPAW